MKIGDELRAFAEKVQKSECVWGKDDCTRWAANWVEIKLGRSLHLPAYGSEAEARRLIEAAGGLVNLWSAEMSKNGIYETFDWKAGDVGIVKLREAIVGCIILHDDVAMLRATIGVRFIRPRTFLKAWAI